MKCSMKSIQSIFNDVPKSKGYDKCKKIEKSLADGVYIKMLNATESKVIFNLPVGVTGKNVIYALMVKYMPYTVINKRWYEVQKHDDGTRDLIITTKWFRLYLERNIAIKQKIVDIVEELHISEDMNEYFVAMSIAEYLASHIKYDYDDKGGYDAYWGLIKGTTICCGYSESYKVLCDYCGIKCQCLLGGGHQWNRVYIDGHWKNVDITWISTGSSKFKYLLTDDKIFYDTHMPLEQKMAKYWKYK